MKVGDIIFSTKIRPGEHAVIVKADVVRKDRIMKNGNTKKETRTTYQAQYKDGCELTFSGFNINKSIFSYIKPNGHINLEEFMNKPEIN